jgi:hypothetical protein
MGSNENRSHVLPTPFTMGIRYKDERLSNHSIILLHLSACNAFDDSLLSRGIFILKPDKVKRNFYAYLIHYFFIFMF